MSTPRNAVAAAALAGAASGARSFTGLAALAVTAPRGAQWQPDRILRRKAVRAAVALGALGEYVGDKLPQAPSRLEFPGFAGRLVLAAGCGVVAARRTRPALERAAAKDPQSVPATPPSDPRVTAAAVTAAVATSAAASWLGARWRGSTSRAAGRDWPGAVLEDLVALSLAGAAAVTVA